MSIHAVGDYIIHLNYVGHISPFHLHIIVFSRDMELNDLIAKGFPGEYNDIVVFVCLAPSPGRWFSIWCLLDLLVVFWCNSSYLLSEYLARGDI